MANDDVLIVGKLDDKDLLDSIDNLIKEVSDKSQVMANKFEKSMNIMKDAMKDFAVTQKVSVDLMKESWREMSASFDAMVAAQSGATGGGKGKEPREYAPNTIGALENYIATLEKQRKEMKLNSSQLAQLNVEIENQKNKLKELKSIGTDQNSIRYITKQIGAATSMGTKSISDAEAKLRRLLDVQRRFGSMGLIDETKMNRLQNAIDTTRRKIETLKSKAPKSIKEVMGMDESSIDAIARKMSALKRVSINPQNADEIHQLGSEYQRLSRLQAELMGKGIQLTHANNYLAQSFGYIRNRIVYALTLGAVTNFTKQIYEVRGQYELLERSLGILIDDMRRGSELFNELNAMALKSPFTLMELATGAKQLLAYNFAEEEVVDTTRRLADISSALGVPMERLVYNLGQIRAQTALTARDARDFANAGLAIVPMLAQMYTEEKRFGNEIVTTAQVFDMMSKKMVSYADVMKVINKVTDEGGKFFDFQAKQAETLRVRMANLTLAWNNMLNEIGQENQRTLTIPLNGLKLLFENWRRVYDIIKDIIVLYGIYRARAILVSLVNGTLITQAYISGMYNFGRAIRYVTAAWKTLSVAVATNPLGAVAAVVAACAASFMLFGDSVDDAIEGQERFGKAGAKVISDAESMFDSLMGLSQGSSNYKKILGELNSILGEYDIELIKETDSIDEVNKKRAAAISLIKQETLERKYLNDVQQGRDEYQSKVEDIRKNLRTSLSNAITENFLGIGTVNDEIAKNAPAIANIVSDVIERNISTIAGKTGDEYEKGVEKIFAEIDSRMKAIGISEETRSKGWLENSVFRAFKDDIITKAIDDMVEARQSMEDYTGALEKNYEAEQKAAESGASFNDRVEQTQTRLMKAANDTDNFAKKVDQLLRQYGGENIIDFLVKVRTEVPAWMNQKGLTELTQLSARFAALATNAKKAGKTSLNVNGTEFSVEQLFQRAAQYTQAAQNKAKDIEARKSSTITREASEALKQYKSALEAVTIAQNKFNRGKADQALVTEKQTEAQKAYDKALEKGVSLKELRKAKNGGKGSGSKKDPLGTALEKEIQLISDIQKMYKTYQKAGVDADTARIASAKEYENTLKATNATLARFGIKGLSGEQLATMDMRELRDFYQKLRKDAQDKGNTKGVEALEKAIRSLNIEITKVDYKKITDGLNNELGKIKEDYELAVELDANPELGNMFADMFDIDTSNLPRTFDQALAKVQESVDKALAQIGVDQPFDVLKDDVKAFAQAVGQSLDGDAVKGLEKAQAYIRGLWKKDTEETVKNWNTLLEKYGDFQTKLIKATQETAQEQLGIIRKFGSSEEQAQAIDLSKKITLTTDQDVVARVQQQLKELVDKVVKGNDVGIKLAASVGQSDSKRKAKIEWDNFKDGDYYSMMFEDMDRVSTRAIHSILAQLDALKSKVKDDPASMKALMDAYKKGRDELESRAPFENIVESLKEWRKSSIEAAAAERELKAANEELKNAQDNLANVESQNANQNDRASDFTKADRLAKAKERLAEATKKQNQAEVKAANAEIKQISAQTKFQDALNNSATALQNVGSLLTQFAELLGIAEDSEAGEMVKSLAQGFTMMATALSLVASVAAIAELSLGWVAAAVAALTILVSLVSFLAGASNRKITNEINEIERDVHSLEIAYRNLEQAADDAYGAMVSGAKAALIANKQAQLEDLERQYELAKSRTGKHYDQDEVDKYHDEMVDLRNEIRDLTQEITQDLLDISSAGDGITDLVDVMIEAFRNGEDAMQAFGDKWDEMIDNMILKLLVTTFMQKGWDNVMKTLEEKEQEFLDKASAERSEAQKQYDKVLDMSNDEVAQMIAEQLGYQDKVSRDKRELEELRQRGEIDARAAGMNTHNATPFYFLKAWQQVTEEEVAAYRKMLEESISGTSSSINDASVEYTKWALEYMNGEGREYMTNYAEMLKNALGDWYSYGQDQQNNLSALQQGIQGITEDTAGALEAYMNSVSQQVYLQSELITQIRDAVVGLDLDVQVATMSQMLLQLQMNYQIVQSIESMMANWQTPSGNGIRVELLS